MKSKGISYFLLILLGASIGYMVGVSMDPVDRAIRKAQKINRANLAGVSSLREGGSMNIFGLFTKKKSLQEKIDTDTKFSNEYVNRISNTMAKKEEAIALLDETKEFIDLEIGRAHV